MAKYRKKPVVIEAFQWNGKITLKEPMWIVDLILAKRVVVEDNNANEPMIFIKTLEGTMVAEKGDYIIKGVQGELYPCKSDIFKQTYEEVVE